MTSIIKYPRTHHIEGSRLQPGDEDLESVQVAELAGQHLVIEEKLDGANCGISFTAGGDLRLQSRGHFLTGGYRERHFNLFKTWASTHRSALWELLGARFVAYGEWLYAKHTVYYDRLPHYFMEFDILDRESRQFLNTPRRHAMLAGSPIISVPILETGPATSRAALERLVGPSLYKSSEWRESLRSQAEERGIDVERAVLETDASTEMEGLYIKVEDDEHVTDRYKLIRASFLTTVTDSGSHWLDRPIVPNRLADGVDLFAGVTGKQDEEEAAT